MIRRLNGISAVFAFLAVSTLAEAQNGKLFRIGIGGILLSGGVNDRGHYRQSTRFVTVQ